MASKNYKNEQDCPFRAVGGGHRKLGPGNESETHGLVKHYTADEVKKELGENRVFDHSYCPKKLESALVMAGVSVRSTRISLRPGYLKRLVSGDLRQAYLFCIPRLSMSIVQNVLAGSFTNLARLTDGACARRPLTGDKKTADWEWFVVSKIPKLSRSEDLRLLDVIYINILFRRATGENFFPERIACTDDKRGRIAVCFDGGGNISIPKWNGIGEEFHVQGIRL
ncbi:MAG: hypothetical protein WCO09_01660 [bacterium]